MHHNSAIDLQPDLLLTVCLLATVPGYQRPTWDLSLEVSRILTSFRKIGREEERCRAKREVQENEGCELRRGMVLEGGRPFVLC